MNIQKNTIIVPLPNEKTIAEKERKWRLKLPPEYIKFLKMYNGGVPEEKTFVAKNHSYAISRFLGIVEDIKTNELGWYDIGVVESQIGERLTENMELIGMEVMPIAELYGGDYVCLDFRKDKENPEVCIWYHEESGDFLPVTNKVADSFGGFIDSLS